MNATGKRRLLKLADFLETKVPPKHFDMDRWGTGNGDKGGPLCGTDACALGWASAIPSLRKAGVILRRWGFSENPSVIANRVFGVDYNEFRHLFCSEPVFSLKGKSGVKKVAARIRAFVAKAA